MHADAVLGPPSFLLRIAHGGKAGMRRRPVQAVAGCAAQRVPPGAARVGAWVVPPARQHGPSMPDAPPSPDELRAFCAGSLPPARFSAVDAWLAALDEAEAACVLAEAAGDQPGLDGVLAPTRPAPGFTSDLPRGRLRPGLPLGAGGMAVVSAAHDRVLDRVVALKVLRPRRVDEPLEQFQAREAAFRCEAALTAGLEHPAIPPVYDVGRSDGLPAFAMKRLDGRTLDALITAGGVPLSELVAILVRVAEAVGYAHSRGVVHRDLTPRNILVAEFGAVYVLDWGLAVPVGTRDGVRAGTPAWMAPEQGVAAADPRQDVYALGALVRFGFTGLAPEPGARHTSGPEVRAPGNLPKAIPRGIAALIRRCLAPDPAARYPHAGAVADDLRRWLGDGITLAQDANRLERAWLRLRRSPRVRAGLAAGLVALALVLAGWAWQARQARAEAEARLARIAADAVLDRSTTVAVALAEVRAIAIRHPRLAAPVEARLQTAFDLAARREREDAVRVRLTGLLHRTRTLGPWADQVQAWRQAIRDAGLSLDVDRIAADAVALAASPLRSLLAESLAFLWRAEKERGADSHADATVALLAAGGPTPGWQALGRLLGRSRFAGGEPLFCPCADSDATLTEAPSAATALALFAPEPRLTVAAQHRMADRPGDFWPLIASARASLAEGDVGTTERLALIASGAEPDSVLPPLLLAYVALARDDVAALVRHVARGRSLVAGSTEVEVLHAVALTRQGRVAEAQALIDRLDPAPLSAHRRNHVGHPMERSVQALLAAGVRLPGQPAGSAPAGDDPR